MAMVGGGCRLWQPVQARTHSLLSDHLLAVAAILFYWITMKVVQQLTCLTLGCPKSPAYSTGELLNTPLAILRFRF